MITLPAIFSFIHRRWRRLLAIGAILVVLSVGVIAGEKHLRKQLP